jgi:hypothetical protein
MTILLGVTLASQPYIGRAYAGVLMYVPAILGAILVSTLPYSNKVGLLFSYWISSEPPYDPVSKLHHLIMTPQSLALFRSRYS